MTTATRSSEQLIDILLNRNDAAVVVDMVRARARERDAAAKIVSALPPGIEQRTPAWYAARKGMLTASDFKIAGASEVNHAYVMSKVFPAPFVSNDAMVWGCRFEDLACATYEIEHAATVREFGLLVHPEAAWIGASPDGITPYGVAVEIKCPFSRKRVEIDKRVADERPFPKSDRANLHARYRAQIQGQLEVCDLECCDFVVAHIDELDDATFWQLRRVSDARHRYAIVVDVPAGPDSDRVSYHTAPVHSDDASLMAWVKGITAGAPGARVWHVHVRELGVERVARDRTEWARLRAGLGRTKSAIDAAMSGAAPSTEDAPTIVGNPPLFGTDYASDVDADPRRPGPETSAVVARSESAPATVAVAGDMPTKGKACLFGDCED